MKEEAFRRELENHVNDGILKYWVDKAFDYEKNRLYGWVMDDLEGNTIKTMYQKTSILVSRILWVFSNAYERYKKEEYKKCAYICYDNLINDCYDNKNGGVLWHVDYGEETRKILHNNYKHLYSESFAIYGLSAFYRVFGNEDAIKYAYEIYNKIIENCTDIKNGGFYENMNEKWEPVPKYALAPNSVDCVKTMNTTLHFMEALCELYSVTKDEKIKDTTICVLDIIFEKLLTDEKDALKMFFDEKYNSDYDAFSPGHDIETSWLIVKCAETIGDKKYIQKARDLAIRIGRKVKENGIDDKFSVLTGIGSVYENDIWKKYGRDWWAYAEAVIGYFNLYEITGDYSNYETCQKIWNATKEHLVDEKHGEWIGYYLLPEHKEYFKKPDKAPSGRDVVRKISPWKCCYHSTRMCFEIIDRLK